MESKSLAFGEFNLKNIPREAIRTYSEHPHISFCIMTDNINFFDRCKKFISAFQKVAPVVQTNGFKERMECETLLCTKREKEHWNKDFSGGDLNSLFVADTSYFPVRGVVKIVIPNYDDLGEDTLFPYPRDLSLKIRDFVNRKDALDTSEKCEDFIISINRFNEFLY